MTDCRPPADRALDLPDDPKLMQNIVWFARALRKAGIPIGPGRVLTALRAVAVAGFSDRRDFYHVLASCFIGRAEHRAIYDQIFRLYWRDPRYVEHMMALLVPSVRGTQDQRRAQPAERRAAEALLDGAAADPPLPVADDEALIEIDARGTQSDTERLRHLDFEQMSVAEMTRAKAVIARMAMPVRPLPSRRGVPDPRGNRPDWPATMRAAARTAGELRQLRHRRVGTRMPSLVAICDISGSMSVYSRFILHFLHAMANRPQPGWSQIHAFTFGTRLTNITRHLRHRDVDAALAAAGAEAQDWEGGTRIGACLTAFNRDWSRRIMGQGAVVLLITDGLERGDSVLLGRATERLHLSARRLIWVNPLLRFDAFAPRAAGIAAMLPHIDSLRAGHDIASLEGLAEALCSPHDNGDKARLLALV
ncbi:VWA domain CoxE-like family protein [Oceaniovalibus guishaninsula JLT2003]|uniref:VWA domain CoxE-like family protein n=1 Tax=Oceaniovalibus guishaninsula JLT2003 TaxID=1231392 RepID=K2GR55_9RHOB|nr:VWA domain-containing protein [Oceaniovalibus guishaninsula]EKE45076.1 VWA domain CoxE-like family protein [Oceaniovalibus guishaninsula JLT2003]